MTPGAGSETTNGPAHVDAVTFAFGDPAAEVYGIARLAVSGGGASGMAIVYDKHEPVAGAREAGRPLDGASETSWDDVAAAGVSTTTQSPHEAWTVSFDDEHGTAFDLRFEAISTPAPVQAAGVEGGDQLCSVSGTVRLGERTVEISCLGQRSHLLGAPDLDRVEIARTLSAWLGADRAVTLTAVRPTRAKRHQLDETVTGWMIEGGEPVAIAEPRLSTTYDGELHQQRAGLELWMDEEHTTDRRASGQVLCGMTVDLGALRLDNAFFSWRMEGREGVGLYDVLRRVDRKSSKR
ncbi:MAG: hypothetical protein QOG15_459 [Solirubrobacteraceae bacterium]|nr:hypothetical protein [Solirubrobacteraceae bacterium]